MTDIPTPEDEARSYAEFEAIAAPLQRYIDAARTGDATLMRTAFLEGASVRGSFRGKTTDWTGAAFCDIIAKGGPAADMTARIVAIEHQGNAGMARLEAQNWRGTRYTDFFVLVQRDGEWRI